MMIQIKDLHKSFGEKKVLKGISFDIREGEIVFILGTSGTGKSVTLKLIVGLMYANAGEIWVDGENITQFSEDEFFGVRKKAGMVFQHPALLDSITVFENVAFGLRRHTKFDEDTIRNRVTEVLHLVGLHDIEHKMPQDLSYGMQKRVSLARTVAYSPKIVMYDEPTTGLDPVTTNQINTLIQSLARELKVTSLIVSHDMHCALAIADRIIVLDKGHVVALGSPQEILKHEHPLVVDFLREAKEKLAEQEGHRV